MRRAERLCKSAKYPQLHRFLSNFPPSTLRQGAIVRVSGHALSDRDIGKRMTFVAATGPADEALCSVEDLVIVEAANMGW